MKTICIHPKDSSTDFLARIYKDKDWEIVTEWSGTKAEFTCMLKNYDRIIMMGHGTPGGLLNVNNFFKKGPQCGFVIDSSQADILKAKDTVSIWCNSDRFAEMHKLPGFHTGMIISEVCEASWVLGETPLTAEETLDNMNLFADVVGRHIDDLDLLNLQRCIRNEYNRTDPVSVYNRENIIVFNSDGERLQ